MQPVKPNIHLLIKTLEKERRALVKMARQAAAEKDHLIVYYHSEALSLLESRLEALYSFNDPLYLKKDQLRRQIDFFKSLPYSKIPDRIKEHYRKKYSERINGLEGELQQLIDSPSPIFENTDIIGHALFALYEKRYKSFKLIINREEKFGLQFKIKKVFLVITVIGKPFDDEPDFVLHGRMPNPFEGMGFKPDEQSGKFSYTFNITGFNDPGPIKQWLSRFLIDFCRLYGWNNTIDLVYQ